MVKKALLLSCLCFALVVGSASAAQLHVPHLKPLSTSSAWFRVGDYSTTLRGIPSASPEYLAQARITVHALRHRLYDTVQRRDRHRRSSVRRQARSLHRQLKRAARANAAFQRHKARGHYRERRHDARQIANPERRRKKLRHARRLFIKRKLEIERSRLDNLKEARHRTARARAPALHRAHHLRRVDRSVAHVQNRELGYQFRALRNRS
jgi:hypothetical protein